MIRIYNTFIEPQAPDFVQQVLQSSFISEGTVVKDFERQLEKDLGLTNCVTLNSGTSALHLALVMIGVQQGDEVILPAQTFVATGLVVVQQLAQPVFADIDYGNGNVSPQSIRAKVTPRTKAIIVVHWAGYPCDMDEILQIAGEFHIPVIEDAAHALGAVYKGRAIGSISPFTCFSFQAIKHLTTGDGGALCLASVDLKKEALSRRWFGIDREHALPTEEGERAYNIQCLGFKYHLNNYAAALGLANMQGIAARLEGRRKVAAFYDQQLDAFPGINRFNYSADRKSAYWLYGLHVERRRDFIRALRSRGVEASVIHQRIDRNTIFGQIRKDLTNQESFDHTQVHIPIHDAIDLPTAEKIVASIKMGW
ncbi:MAG: DegT/DnrJ/EryC1/StrS family aminotransferase [Cyclobacteriaceae bacterium]|nr:DegT/DnrJ/EryC1/StrS family aminotransferase [Cyclobacteriaceae bacterium]